MMNFGFSILDFRFSALAIVNLCQSEISNQRSEIS